MNTHPPLHPLLIVIIGSFMTLIQESSLLMAADADQAALNSVIIQFNGSDVAGVAADTKNKSFKPVFEKELARLSGELAGKPTLEIKHWYTLINGAAVHISQGPDDTVQKLMVALKKLSYVKTVEQDAAVSVNGGIK